MPDDWQVDAELGPLHQALALSFPRKQPPTAKKILNEGMLIENLRRHVFMLPERDFAA